MLWGTDELSSTHLNWLFAGDLLQRAGSDDPSWWRHPCSDLPEGPHQRSVQEHDWPDCCWCPNTPEPLWGSLMHTHKHTGRVESGLLGVYSIRSPHRWAEDWFSVFAAALIPLWAFMNTHVEAGWSVWDVKEQPASTVFLMCVCCFLFWNRSCITCCPYAITLVFVWRRTRMSWHQWTLQSQSTSLPTGTRGRWVWSCGFGARTLCLILFCRGLRWPESVCSGVGHVWGVLRQPPRPEAHPDRLRLRGSSLPEGLPPLWIRRGELCSESLRWSLLRPNQTLTNPFRSHPPLTNISHISTLLMLAGNWSLVSAYVSRAVIKVRAAPASTGALWRRGEACGGRACRAVAGVQEVWSEYTLGSIPSTPRGQRGPTQTGGRRDPREKVTSFPCSRLLDTQNNHTWIIYVNTNKTD